MSHRRLMRAVWLMAAAILLDLSRASAQVPASAESVAFLVGCWQQTTGDGLREYYGPPAENMMTGLSQFWRDGRIVDWEFHRIDFRDAGPVLTPHPRGVESVSFRPVALGKRRIVWENTDHDFPNRIVYERIPGDSLVVRIEGDGPETRASSWRMARVACGSP